MSRIPTIRSVRDLIGVLLLAWIGADHDRIAAEARWRSERDRTGAASSEIGAWVEAEMSKNEAFRLTQVAELDRLLPKVPVLPVPRGELRLPNGQRLKPERLFASDEGSAAMLGRAWYTKQGMAVIASIDNTDRFGDLLHVSLSYHHRDPNWQEIKAVRDTFFPQEVDVMMVLPKAADYVNIHKHTFHLVQMPTEWNIQ